MPKVTALFGRVYGQDENIQRHEIDNVLQQAAIELRVDTIANTSLTEGRQYIFFDGQSQAAIYSGHQQGQKWVKYVEIQSMPAEAGVPSQLLRILEKHRFQRIERKYERLF